MPGFNWLSHLAIPLISLSGMLAGWLLQIIAPEEIVTGRKYFVILYRSIFLATSLIISFFLNLQSSASAIAYLVFSLILLFMDLRKHHPCFFVVHYLFLLIGYLFSAKPIVAALIFLYGLPVGTLLGASKNKKSGPL